MRTNEKNFYVNPFARLKLFRNAKINLESISDLLIICAPCRSRGLVTTVISGKSSSEFMEFFKKVSVLPILKRSMVRDKLVQKGIETGLLMQKNRLPSHVSFRCPVPPTRTTREVKLNSPLILNPGIQIEKRKTQVRLSFSRAMISLDLSPKELISLKRLRNNSPDLKSLNKKTRSRFAYLNILLPRPDRASEKAKLKKSASEFKRVGLVTLPSFFPQVLAESLADYSHRRIEQGFVVFGDHRVKKRYCDPSDVIAVYYQRQYQKALSKLIGEPLKPSYAYIYSYSEGAILPRHLDHRGSDYVVSIALACEKNGKSSTPWPIYFERAGVWPKPKKITMEPGDAVLYRGQQLHHWRKPLGPQKKCVVLVMTYVKRSRS